MNFNKDQHGQPRNIIGPREAARATRSSLKDNLNHLDYRRNSRERATSRSSLEVEATSSSSCNGSTATSLERTTVALGSSSGTAATPEASATLTATTDESQTLSSYSDFNPTSRSSEVPRSVIFQAKLSAKQVEEIAERVRLYRIFRRPIPVGLMNQGNSCYLNAVLQTLFALPAFTDWLFYPYAAGLHVAPCRRPYFADGKCRDQCFICGLAQVGFNMFTKTAAVSPKIVYDVLVDKKTRLQQGRQEDAHELFVQLRSAFIKEMTSLSPKAPNLIDQWFGFKISTTKTCVSCKHESITKQDFHELLLDIHDDHVTDIIQALQARFVPMITTNTLCEHCRSSTNNTRTDIITEMPPYLWIVLNRFGTSGEAKNMRRVQMNNFIEFGTSGNETDQEQLVCYRLKAVIYHSGTTIHNGHYFVVVRCPDDRRLHKFNDDAVPHTVETWELVNDSDATPYLLVFEQVPEGPGPEAADDPVVTLCYNIIELQRNAAVQGLLLSELNQKMAESRLKQCHDWLVELYSSSRQPVTSVQSEGPTEADRINLDRTFGRIVEISSRILEAEVNNTREAQILIEERDQLLNSVGSILVKFAPTSKQMPRKLTETDKIELGKAMVSHFFSGSPACFNMDTFKDKNEMRKIVDMVPTFKVEAEGKQDKWASFLANTAKFTNSHFHKFLKLMVEKHRCQKCKTPN